LNKIKWIIFAVVSVSAIAGLVVYSNNTTKNTDLFSGVDAYAVLPANDSNGNIADHLYNENDSKIVLIEYGDYQCPACGTYNPTIEKIAEDYKNKIKFVFRNYLLSYHANSKAAAATAESAGLQGKYWEMHKKLYSTQSDWESLDSNARTSYFLSLATSLGLDTDKFSNDIASSAVSDKIAYDVASAAKIRLTGTPSFYLNGKEIEYATWSDETKLRARIDSVIAEADNN